MNWRARLGRDHVAPVIAVAGTRGKTSVIRAVESIFAQANLRVATWTDRGVEIGGQRQRGELGPWSRAMTRLTAGGLDVALQEIDWATIQAVGVPGRAYPIIAVSNLCANNEACLLTPHMMMARKALARLRTSISDHGRLILNADDFAIADDVPGAADRVLIGMSPESPILRRHLQNGGDACWLEHGQITEQRDTVRTTIVAVSDLPWTRGGEIPFGVQNALLAAAIGRECGLSYQVVASGLTQHDAAPGSVPGSFNVIAVGDSTVVIDVPAASWFLRNTIRAVQNLDSGRHIRIAGPMNDIPDEDLMEIGRLLGRSGGVLIFHGLRDGDRFEQLRAGAAGNQVPPLVVQSVDERSAIQQGLGMLKPRDIMLVLAEEPAAAVRLVERQVHRSEQPSRRTPGAA
ncbi:MAG: hypothetical protein U0031_07405 [Thermomicrobiales bacterium]